MFEELTRRARETVWLTPEPKYSWPLGRCDLPHYAEYCDRVQVVRNLHGLDLAALGVAMAERSGFSWSVHEFHGGWLVFDRRA